MGMAAPVAAHQVAAAAGTIAGTPAVVEIAGVRQAALAAAEAETNTKVYDRTV